MVPAAIAQQAKRLLHRPVVVLEFGNIEGKAKFDGIWAGASLLHVPIEHLGFVVARIHRILRPGGVLVRTLRRTSYLRFAPLSIAT